MNTPTILALLIAALVAGGALVISRTLITSAVRYREDFEASAHHNLAEMFLFIEPQKLFGTVVLIIVMVFILILVFGGGPMLAVLAAAALGASPPFVYWYLRRRRRRRAIEQMPDALLSIATNMRSGLSLNQALETTITYEHPPLGQELTLVLRELRVGVPFNDAMDNLYKRIPEVEVQLVAAAMKVSREIGGNLSEALERISDTLRKRLQMEGKIRSLTAQGKLQGLVMVGLPIFLIVTLSQMEPAAMHYMFHAWYGWAVVGVIIIMEAIGYHFILKIVNIDV